MINGAHVLLLSRDPEADRAFLRDVLGMPSVDAGMGWLIFGLPPAEAAVHPLDDDSEPDASGGGEMSALLYWMCDDLTETIRWLEEKNVRCTSVSEQPWGRRTTIILPSGGEIGLYQPTHPTATGLQHSGRR